MKDLMTEYGNAVVGFVVLAFAMYFLFQFPEVVKDYSSAFIAEITGSWGNYYIDYIY